MDTNWLDQPLTELVRGQVIGRRQAVSELPGWWRKRLHVARGQVAALSAPGEKQLILPAGSHPVGGWWSRYTGRLSQSSYVTLPTEPLVVPVAAPRLADKGQFVLAGDGEMVDVAFQAALEVAPERFVQRLVDPRGQVSLFDLQALLAQWAAPGLATAVQQYAAQDLADPAVSQAVQAELARHLRPLLADVGLNVTAVTGLTIRPAEEIVALAERTAALQARLRQVAQEDEMGRLSQTAELQQFARQLEVDFDLPGLAAAVNEQQAAQQPVTALQDAAQTLAQGRLAGESVHRPAGTEPPAPAPAAPADSKPEPVWLRWLTLFRYALSFIMILLAIWEMTPDDPDYFGAVSRMVIYAATLLVGIVSTIWLEERTRRERLIRRRMDPSSALPQDELLRADRILRQLATTELEQVQSKLKEARFKLFQAGDKENAGRLKEVEQRAERMASELGQAAVGRAAYLSLDQLTTRQLATMRQYDDKLAQQISQIGDGTQALLAAAIGGTAVVHKIASLEVALTNFDHQFKARARLLHS